MLSPTRGLVFLTELKPGTLPGVTDILDLLRLDDNGDTGHVRPLIPGY